MRTLRWKFEYGHWHGTHRGRHLATVSLIPVPLGHIYRSRVESIRRSAGDPLWRDVGDGYGTLEEAKTACVQGLQSPTHPTRPTPPDPPTEQEPRWKW